MDSPEDSLIFLDLTDKVRFVGRKYSVRINLCTAPWMYPTYPEMPHAVPDPGAYTGHWVAPHPPPGLPQGPFPAMYHPPPYPPPQIYHPPPDRWPANNGTDFEFWLWIPRSDPRPDAVANGEGESPSYQWPDGNVKLECTTGQEPEGWDDQGWMWRSSGARRRGLPDGALKVEKRAV
ncbi:hypothetical protein B0H19DRAFT_1271087 [Mycena capillaripes]|nr:hypothetical protein B0H19DRAFT_1271087 [Mycena capillaripes]